MFENFLRSLQLHNFDNRLIFNIHWQTSVKLISRGWLLMAAQIKPTSFQKCDIFINVPTFESNCVFTFYILYLSVQYLYFRPRSLYCSQKARVIPQNWTSVLHLDTIRRGLEHITTSYFTQASSELKENPRKKKVLSMFPTNLASGDSAQIPLS